VFADVLAGGVLLAGGGACVVGGERPVLVRLALAVALACAGAAELSGDDSLWVAAAAVGAVAIAALVRDRAAGVDRLSWLDGVMGASASAALAVSLGADAQGAIAIGGVLGGLSLARWRPTPIVIVAVAGLAALGVGGAVAPVAAFAFPVAAWWSEERAQPGPEFSPIVLTAIVAFALTALTVLTIGQFDQISDVSVALALLTVLAGMARAGMTVVARLRDSELRAITDELTGLANRRAVMRRVAELSQAETPLALALLDLDKFKEVNDGLGHAVGDELLRKVAERLQPALRAGDLLGRLGGDEFAVVAPMDPHSDLQQTAVQLGTRLHGRLAAPFSVGGLFVHSSVSVGVTTTRGVGGPDASESASNLLREADVAMYDAKRSGVGVALYDTSRHADSSGHLVLVEELRTALTTGQLVLHYQPQLDVLTGRTVGVEALVRWAHPVRGLLPPAEFLPLAEVHGLMAPLTEVVLAQAVAQVATWRHAGLDLLVSVNLSASNLLDRSLPGRVAELLAAHAVPPSSIILEVTESVLLTDPDRSLAVVGALADLGLTVSIDDFGTGYSSLAYLRDLPVRELKLDRSFTNDLLVDDRTRAIVASTIDLAHQLGLRVVAEGVEQEETLRDLAFLGSDLSQGFLHSRPLPPDELQDWLSRTEAAAAAR
jgi:diguanylate cyclase (GGDEF)-like protein